MSYCEIIVFKNGLPAESVKFSNSWGGAAFIWSALFDKYLKDPAKKYDTWVGTAGNADNPLWSLAKRSDIPLFMRAVHASTFDRAIIRREHFKQFAAHLREFVSYFGTGGGDCHLPAWADFTESCEAEAIGFYGTSVSQNLWFDYDEEKDESIPYDLNARDEHFEVYDMVAEDARALLAELEAEWKKLK